MRSPLSLLSVDAGPGCSRFGNDASEHLPWRLQLTDVVPRTVEAQIGAVKHSVSYVTYGLGENPLTAHPIVIGWVDVGGGIRGARADAVSARSQPQEAQTRYDPAQIISMPARNRPARTGGFR